MGTIAGGGIAPHEAVANDMDDAAEDLSVIDAWDAAHLVGQQGLKSDRLRIGESEVMIGHDEPPHGVRVLNQYFGQF